MSTRLGIPMMYGIDAVHGNSKVYNATIFPHNIGLGVTRQVIKYRFCLTCDSFFRYYILLKSPIGTPNWSRKLELQPR